MPKSKPKCAKEKDPKTCSPEQIRECHGPVRSHPCAKK